MTRRNIARRRSPRRPIASLPRPYDLVGWIMDFEGGEMSEEKIIQGFQHLVDTGLVWKLQGSYGRTARSLIEQGLVFLPEG